LTNSHELTISLTFGAAKSNEQPNRKKDDDVRWVFHDSKIYISRALVTKKAIIEVNAISRDTLEPNYWSIKMT
jgi:hypothetical protein